MTRILVILSDAMPLRKADHCGDGPRGAGRPGARLHPRLALVRAGARLRAIQLTDRTFRATEQLLRVG